MAQGFTFAKLGILAVIVLGIPQGCKFFSNFNAAKTESKKETTSIETGEIQFLETKANPPLLLGVVLPITHLKCSTGRCFDPNGFTQLVKSDREGAQKFASDFYKAFIIAKLAGEKTLSLDKVKQEIERAKTKQAEVVNKIQSINAAVCPKAVVFLAKNPPEISVTEDDPTKCQSTTDASQKKNAKYFPISQVHYEEIREENSTQNGSMNLANPLTIVPKIQAFIASAAIFTSLGAGGMFVFMNGSAMHTVEQMLKEALHFKGASLEMVKEVSVSQSAILGGKVSELGQIVIPLDKVVAVNSTLTFREKTILNIRVETERLSAFPYGDLRWGVDRTNFESIKSLSKDKTSLAQYIVDQPDGSVLILNDALTLKPTSANIHASTVTPKGSNEGLLGAKGVTLDRVAEVTQDTLLRGVEGTSRFSTMPNQIVTLYSMAAGEASNLIGGRAVTYGFTEEQISKLPARMMLDSLYQFADDSIKEGTGADELYRKIAAVRSSNPNPSSLSEIEGQLDQLQAIFASHLTPENRQNFPNLKQAAEDSAEQLKTHEGVEKSVENGVVRYSIKFIPSTIPQK